MRVDSSFAGPVTLHVQAGNNTQSFTVTVVANKLNISTPVLPDATQGTAYNQTLTASGGSGSYTSFAVTVSSLPNGLTLATNGTLSGTPSAAGSFAFTITATSATGSQSYTVTIAAATYVVTPVTPSPNSLEAWESTTFTATITKNGAQVPAGETVTWTVESGNGRFTSGSGSDTSRTSTTSLGSASITLQGTAAGSVTVKASIGGADGQGNVTFTAPTYAISFPSPPSGSQTASVQITAKVVNSSNTPVEGVSVSWSYANAQSGSPSTSLSGTSTAADGTTTSPSVPHTSGERRIIAVKATVGSVSNSVPVQFGDTLPNEVIAVAPGPRNWHQAVSYCTDQGGKLPGHTRSVMPVKIMPRSVISRVSHRTSTPMYS